nr:hypothetical protein [Tanacetum cinerariifolium]
MIMHSKDNLYNGRKGIGFENPSYFEKSKRFETNALRWKANKFTQTICSDVILEKIIIDLEDEVVNLLEKEKVNLETIESLKSKGFEPSENVSSESENQTENDCLVVEKEYLDTFSSVRRPKNSGVIWKKKGSSNTSNVGLSVVSVSNLNKNVKRYSRKYLLACNNSHLGETRSDFFCNDAMNISCDSRMNDLLDDNNFFIFNDVNVRISPVSKMPFRKKPCDSMHLESSISTSFLKFPAIKQLAIKRWDEYGFVIHPGSIRFPSLQIEPVRIWLSKVEPLLVAFDSQLKIFYTSLNDDASCKHSKRDVKIELFLNYQIRQLSFYKK